MFAAKNSFLTRLGKVYPPPPTGYLSWNSNLIAFSRLDMVTDTTSASTINLINDAGGTASNSGVAGYRYGTTANGVTCQKFAYSNEAVTTLANSLPQFRAYATGGSNSGTAGYITGGATGGFVVRYKTIVKSPFSTDTPATLGTGFTDMGNGNGYTSNNHIAGYTYGGESDSGPVTNAINKITYSSDSISNAVATLSVAGRSMGAVSNDGTAGYSGLGTGGTAAIDKLAYSTNTRTTIGATLAASPTYFSAMCYRFQTAGYWGKGGSSATIIQKLLYSSETMSTVISGLSAEGTYNFGEISNNGVI